MAARTPRKRTAKRPAVPQWPEAEPFTAAALTSVSTHNCFLAYANDILSDYGLTDWGWLQNDLAEAMDDAAWSAAQDWIAAHRQALEVAAQWPRWCPCGRWPDFGIGCPYHGACKCVKWQIHAEGGLDGYCWDSAELIHGRYSWQPDWRAYGYRQPAQDAGCPVHPDGPVPDHVLRQWDRRHRGLGLFGSRGITAVPLGEMAANGAGDG